LNYICEFNSLKAKLNPFCHLLALFGDHHILHVSRVRVKHCCHESRYGRDIHKNSIDSSLDIQLDLTFAVVFQHFLQPENMPYVPKSLGD
jgi:hypothetical protein